MEVSRPYSLEELIAELGQPTDTHVNSILPWHTTHVVQEFACGCEGVPAAVGYSWMRCKRHGRAPTVNISDRRCGAVAIDVLMEGGTADLLAALIVQQATQPRDSDGCVSMRFSGAVISIFEESVQRLTAAQILTEVDNGVFALNYFTCFDDDSDEWY